MNKPEDPDRVLIFDTTLRDGEQSPGISLNTQEKLEIAGQLARLGVDVIEAGLPDHLSGRLRGGAGDRSHRLRHRRPAGDRRAGPDPRGRHRRRLQRCQGRRAPRIHTFISTSDIHIQLPAADHARGRQGPGARGGGPRQAVRRRRRVLAHGRHPGRARVHCRGVPDRPRRRARRRSTSPIPSAMPCPRSTPPFCAGCTSWCRACTTWSLSVHCHDDLGLAVANSLAGLRAGARQVECAINGIGERAGNASLEEIVMLLHTREDEIGLRTGAVTREIARTSRMVSRLTGYPVAAQQGDRRAQRVRPRVGDPPGRRAQGAHHLRDHGRHHGRA